MKAVRILSDINPEGVDSFRGATNMAIDETMLLSAAETGVSSLRFYGWQPATLSLGYFQSVHDRQIHRPSHDCELIRRASGGGAILHDCELTYCFATPSKQRFGDSQEHYLAFHETLTDVLKEFDISAEIHAEEDGLSDEAFLCFQRRASGDITLDGQKIVGSAQRRWKNALVQHGSILLRQSEYAPELPGIAELSKLEIPTHKLLSRWIEKISLRLNIEFCPGSLSDKESKEAERLEREKFSNPVWTGRR